MVLLGIWTVDDADALYFFIFLFCKAMLNYVHVQPMVVFDRKKNEKHILFLSMKK